METSVTGRSIGISNVKESKLRNLYLFIPVYINYSMKFRYVSKMYILDIRIYILKYFCHERLCLRGVVKKVSYTDPPRNLLFL